MTNDDTPILHLPVRNKRDDDKGAQLVAVDFGVCTHFNATYVVDQKAGKCVCKDCGGEVSPMFVLEQLMHEESKWLRTRAGYQDEMRRLAERSSTKCRKCGAMTRISKS